ncbi:DUF4845 domain-containing protein [Acinetobacter brisouii]|uniref:DUF4845 domain-containing protein n=1 Tax=Acinetobacter brisouii CIP 110357 TaxID=1341683 RepID=V2VTF0_9GAMM|nr:DUF4845 domain-containing protein [Acinetobacter brisouii]ENV47997.1 hypothetical protein F954_01064 [Acinetobacter brisouii ANC 4119]ESK51029.1 hypothetical protein P255_01529 [Acinetobacter brisouii CIP 110357]
MHKLQRGASYSTFLLALIIFSIVLKVVVAIWPAYWDDHIINKQIQSVLDDNPSLSSAKFQSAMEERLSMNNINDLKIEDIAKVSNDGGQLHVAKHYEVRNHLLLNIDLVLSFEKNFDQRTVQAK